MSMESGSEAAIANAASLALGRRQRSDSLVLAETPIAPMQIVVRYAHLHAYSDDGVRPI